MVVVVVVVVHVVGQRSNRAKLTHLEHLACSFTSGRHTPCGGRDCKIPEENNGEGNVRIWIAGCCLHGFVCLKEVINKEEFGSNLE